MAASRALSTDEIIVAARVPPSLQPQLFSPWFIQRDDMKLLWPWDPNRKRAGFDTVTRLRHVTAATAHLSPLKWVVVMDDTLHELRTHLPIFKRAAGRVLVTGLGLGCVVRGLLHKPEVERIDVVEIDADIIRVVGEEFRGDRRVRLHHGDALTFRLPGHWDFGWHDLWCEGPGLQALHEALFKRFAGRVGWQGAWAMSGNATRRLLGDQGGRHMHVPTEASASISACAGAGVRPAQP
jgi:hypothetical protein